MRFLWIVFLLISTSVFAQTPLGYGNPSTVLETGRVLKTAGGQLFDFQVNIGASGGWVLLIDGPVIPADGALAGCDSTSPSGCVAKWWQVAANSTLGVSWGDFPLIMINGITLVFSTTGPFTKTASATATFSGEVR